MDFFIGFPILVKLKGSKTDQMHPHVLLDPSAVSEYYANMGDEPIQSQDEPSQMRQKEIIVELVNYLLGL